MSLSSITGKTLWLDTSDYSRMLTTAGGSAPTAPDDQIYQFLDGSDSALTLLAPSETTGRPFLRDNGSGQGELDCLNSTANRYLTATDSEATFDHLLTGSGGIALRVKCNNTTAAASELYLDSRGFTNANTGISFFRLTSELFGFSISKAGVGAVLGLTSNLAITDTDEHTFVITIATGASACVMKQDGNVVATATLTATTGPASLPLRVGAISGSGANPANGRIRNLLIKNVPLTAGDETAWLAYEPALGDFSATAYRQGRIGMHLGIGL